MDTHTATNTVYLSDDLKHDLPIMQGKSVTAADVEAVVKEIMAVEKQLRKVFQEEQMAMVERAENAAAQHPPSG